MSRTTIREQREAIQELLESVEGVKKVYYQPPESVKLKYPCIIYDMDSLNTKHADNSRYLSIPKFSITLIDFDPESEIQREILDLDGCRISFNRHFTSDNLHHWSYDLYYTKYLW